MSQFVIVEGKKKQTKEKKINKIIFKPDLSGFLRKTNLNHVVSIIINK